MSSLRPLGMLWILLLSWLAHAEGRMGVRRAPSASSVAAGTAAEMRGLWVASVNNMDWPSAANLTAQEQQKELLALLDMAVADRLNVVMLHVRPTADAFWPSPYEPWSAWLTGTQGQDPGYDPLAFAVGECHARGLQLHAWMNPFRVTFEGGIEKLAPTHPARLHPNWTVTYGGQLLYNPGLPEVRQFVINAMMDAVENYDIDGLHWDDYFYPYPIAGESFDDDAAWQLYGGGFTNRSDWRRFNIDSLVSAVQQRIRLVKPQVQFGISPFAVWRNIATDPAGSNTTAGVQAFDDLYADTRKWVRDGWIDYIVPQIYWTLSFAPANYRVLVDWWAQTVRNTTVRLYVGEGVYRVGVPGSDPAWQDPAELSHHMSFCANISAVSGHVWFSARDVRADRLGAMTMLVEKFYPEPAPPPRNVGEEVDE